MSTINSLRNSLGALLLALIAGCAGVSGPAETPPTHAASGDGNIAGLLAAAEQSLGAQRADYLLKAAGQLLGERNPQRTRELLDEVGTMTLAGPQRARHTELLARLALELGDPQEALRLLQRPELLRAEDRLPTTHQIRLGLARARALAAAGDHLASVQQRISIDPLLSPSQRERNRTNIWRSLMHLESNELERYRDEGVGQRLQGWLELALIARSNQGNLDLQLDRLDNWTRHWSDHPAQQLPGDLRLLRQVAADQPRQVALLLPFSGQLAPFAKALREGFMAALYDSMARGARTPSLRFYDSHGQDIRALYRQAVAEGAESVVGPLEKNQVAALFDEPLTAPVLALNRTQDARSAPANLYQFSLAPEDEAIQLADLARQHGHRRALVIAAENDAKTRELQAFAKRWEQQGGTVVAQALFRDQQSLSTVIRSAFGLPESRARAVALERLLGRDLAFTPRARQDIDMVFMLASPLQARSIKPTLAYHYAGDIPVYALSRSYAGYAQPQLDSDLDGMRFTEMPWILHDSPLKHTVVDTFPQSDNLLRFYAMGIDSFYLQQRLSQLAQLPDSRVYGQTGILRLDHDHIIRRELLLAIMARGRPRALPTTLLRTDTTDTAMEGPNEIDGNRTRRK